MAARQVSQLNEGDIDSTETLVQSLEHQANRFFSGM